METKVEELCRKLKPVIGKKAEALYLNYLSSDFDERKDIEMYLNLLYRKTFNENLSEKGIMLEPLPMETASGEYHVGTVVYNNKELYHFGLQESEWIQHLGIFGRSGSGKTNTCYQIIGTFLEKNKPFLIFDWKRNYRDLLDFFPDKHILVFTVGRNIVPIQFNPLIPPEGTEPTIWLKKLIEIIASTYYVGEGVISLLMKAIDFIYKKFGVYKGNPSIYPTMQDVLNYMEDYHAKGREANWMVSTMRTLQALCFGEMGRVINAENQFNITDLLNKNVVFELDALTNSDKTFFIESLLLYIHHYRLNKPVREKFQHAIIIEEAHHVLRKREMTKNESIIDITLREIRELGESIIYLDQLPSLISIPALGNTNCSITMNLKSQQCVNTAASYTLIDNDNKDIFGRLPIGYGIVKIQSRWSYPFLIKIPHIPIKKGKITDTDIKRKMTGYFPNTFFKSLKNVEKREVADVSQDNEITEIEREFLIQVYKYPYNGTVEKYKRLGLSRKKGHKIRQGLINKGFLKKKEIPTRTGRVVLMELTDKGKTLLKKPGDKISNNPNEGGTEHKYWIHKISNFYKSKGYKVEIEKKISSSEACDIEVTDTNGNKFVVEVQTSEANLEKNVQKNIEAGYKKIVFFATNYKAREGIKSFLIQQKSSLLEDAEIELFDWNSIY
ncbi:ATP-binding protein [Patescibacteria group bacterium]|nr:ATP-binding protein [Patescibacteria group bacterium]